MDLSNKHCVPCEGGVPPMSETEVQKYISQVKGWEVIGGNRRIVKKFVFKDFKETMEFVNAVADISEKENHHPNIYIFYNKVEIELWTHKVRGLSENDFILASKIDLI